MSSKGLSDIERLAQSSGCTVAELLDGMDFREFSRKHERRMAEIVHADKATIDRAHDESSRPKPQARATTPEVRIPELPELET